MTQAAVEIAIEKTRMNTEQGKLIAKTLIRPLFPSVWKDIVELVSIFALCKIRRYQKLAKLLIVRLAFQRSNTTNQRFSHCSFHLHQVNQKIRKRSAEESQENGAH